MQLENKRESAVSPPPLFLLHRAVILGSGSSSSTPKLDCVLGQPSGRCKACTEAVTLGHASRNHRLNPSFLLQFRPFDVRSPSPPSASTEATSDEVVTANVLIDCGKTFRETVLKLFPSLSVSQLHAVLLTHAHCDAMLGLDDLREFCSGTRHGGAVLSVYTDERTQKSLRGSFGFLFPKENGAVPTSSSSCCSTNPPPDKTKHQLMEGKKQVGMYVASLDWRLLPQAELEGSHVGPMALRATANQKDSAAVASSSVTSSAVGVTLTDHGRRGGRGAGEAWIGCVDVFHGPTYLTKSFLVPLITATLWSQLVAAHHHHDAESSSPSSLHSDGLEVPFLWYASDISAVDHTLFERVSACMNEVLARISAHVSLNERPPSLRGRLEIAVLDMLGHTPYPSHFSVHEAVAAAKKCGASRTIFVGMSHSLEYQEMNEWLSKQDGGCMMEMGFDGMEVART